MQKDDRTWLQFSYLIFAALVALSLHKILDLASIQMGWEERYDDWLPYAKIFGSVLVGLVSMAWLRKDSERDGYFQSSITELRKIQWPTSDETRQMTIIVLIFVAIFAGILAGFDILWKAGLGLILT